MEYCLPDELVLIGWRHRTDSMQPEKTVFQEEEEHVLEPFFFFRRTERPDRMGTNKVPGTRLIEMDITVDEGGHLMRTNTLLPCRGVVACAKGYRSYSCLLYTSPSPRD